MRAAVAVAVLSGSTLLAAPTVTSAAADPASSDDCGPLLPKADGTRWDCVMVDHFDGTSLDRSLWSPLVQGGRGDELACNIDDPRTVAVSDGHLNLTIHERSDTLHCAGAGAHATSGNYVSGNVSTWGKFDQQYGRFEARMKSDDETMPGLHEAFWLWPSPGQDDLVWPAAGEIDVAETYSAYPDLVIPYLHYGTSYQGGQPGRNTAWHCEAHRGEFNTYALEWTADRIEIFVNGESCLVNTTDVATYRKRFVVTFTQAIGQATNKVYDGYEPEFPATLQVDYLKVWR